MAFLTIVTLTLTIVGFVHGEMTEEAKNQILQLHNEHRGNLGASNMFKLTWDDELAREATEWNNACVYKHKGLGENLAWNKPASPLPVNELIETAFNDWYEEKNLHSYGSKSCAGSGSCHYTQLAWHDTSRIGCSYTTCSYLTNAAAGAWWIVCMYNPKGNTKRENVFEMGAACSHPDCEGLTCEKNLCVGEKKVKCEDTNKSCLQWAKANQCAVNPTFMKDTCPKSCKICTPEGESESESDACVDDSDKCVGWSKSGECSRNPSYMNGHCRKSCNQC